MRNDVAGASGFRKAVSMSRTTSLLFPAAAMLLSVLLVVLMGACASAPPPIPQDATVAEIIQRAQEAGDTYNWKRAEAYYRVALERFGSDPAVRCACEYEIAFVAYKQGKYDRARAGFNALVALYDGPDGATLPQQWKTLALKVLQKLPGGAPAAAAAK